MTTRQRAIGVLAFLTHLVTFALPYAAHASGIVGSGTPASCTEAALDSVVAGGGLVTFDCGGAATITVTSAEEISADTSIDGGGVVTISGGGTVQIFIMNPGTSLTLNNLTISDACSGCGSGDGYGGAIVNDGGSLTIGNSTFSSNHAPILGGAIYNKGSAELTVTNSTFSSNNAASGSAIENVAGTVIIAASIFSGNGSSGAGTIDSGGTLTVADSTFTGNNGGFGGAISNTGSLSIERSEFDNNRTDIGDGGAISNGATMTLTNSTFSGNSALDCTGGALANYSAHTSTVTNCTFSGNSARHGGALVNGTTGTLIVVNTILVNGQFGGNCAATATVGKITDGGNNLDSDGSCDFNTGTTDPLLDPAGLTNNGGPTDTIALCTTVGTPTGCTGVSPAIGGGNESICAMTSGQAPVRNLDQRSFVRPGVGAANCSIGAFEANSAGAATVTPTSNATITSTPTATHALATSTPALSTNTPTRVATPTPASPTPTQIAVASSTLTPTVDQELSQVIVALFGPNPPAQADLNHDGKVTIADVIEFAILTAGA